MKKRSIVVCFLMVCFLVVLSVSFVNAQACKYYYWIDNTHKDCTIKKFCGDYMYDGLQVFSSKKQCLKAVAALCPPVPITCTEGSKPCTRADGCPSCCPPITAGGGTGFQYAMTGGNGDNVLYLGGVPVYFAPDVQVFGAGTLAMGNATCLYGSGYNPGDMNGQTYDSYIDIRVNPYYPSIGRIYFKGVVIEGADSVFSPEYSPNMSVTIDDDGKGWSMEAKAYCCGGPDHLYVTFTDDYSPPPPVEPSCQNYPPLGFCPDGEQIIVTGYDDSGCAIYGCQAQ